MRALDRRLSALESASPIAAERWHWFSVDPGDDIAAARARYEADEQPILPGDDLVIWTIVDVDHGAADSEGVQ